MYPLLKQQWAAAARRRRSSSCGRWRSVGGTSVAVENVSHVPLDRMLTSEDDAEEWNRVEREESSCKSFFVVDSNLLMPGRLSDAEGAGTARGDGVETWEGCQNSSERMLRLWRRPPGSHAEVKQ